MTNEERILKKLEDIESQLQPMVSMGRSLKELGDDLRPLQNQAFQLMIDELQEVEAGFQLEDLFILIKQMLRSMRSFIFVLRQMESIIEFTRDLEPLLKNAVPHVIEHLDELERKGVFRMFLAMMDVRAKVAAAYTPEDIDQIGDGLVALLGLAKKMSDPRALDFLEKAAALPARVNLSAARKTGVCGLAAAGFNDEIKQGLGVLLELTKALGQLKPNGQPNPNQQPT